MSYVDPDTIKSQLKLVQGGVGDMAPTGEWIKPYAWRPPSEIPPRQWLYGKHFLRDFLTATFAAGAGGKSSLEIAEALAMATGRPLLGVQPEGRFRVAYWNGEDPLEETERRVAAVMIHYGIRPEEVEGWFYWGSGREQGLVIAEQTPDGTTINRPVVDRVKADIERYGLDLVMLDPFVSAHRVTENDNNAIDVVAKTLGKIAGEMHVGFEAVHHTTKAAIGTEARVEHGRGGGALLFACRSARVLNTMSKEEAEAACVSEPARRYYFRVDNGKANLAPPAARSDWFKFEGVPLGNGTGIGDGDEVGVVTTWEWPNSADLTPRAKKPKLTHPGQKILLAFGRLVDQGRTCPAPPVPGVKPGTMAVTDADLRKMATSLGLCTEAKPDPNDKAATTKWQAAARKAWSRGAEEVQSSDRLRFEDGFWWEPNASRVTSRGPGS